MRHANPDLIIDAELQARVQAVCRHLGQGAPLTAPLERVTLFVTDACNLACRYCNGPHLARNRALHGGVCQGYLAEAVFRRWLEDWASAGLKHLHFTGGEPVLHPRLPAFVAAAQARGILCSVTSNGTLPYKRYARLFKAGLQELRISIDAARARDIDAVVGQAGAGRRLLDNLRAFRRLRQSGRRDFWLVFNSCLDVYQPQELWRRLNSLRRLDPDDIKVLVVAQAREALRPAGRRATVARLQKAALAWGGLPLLQRKLQDAFRRDAAGLRDPVVRRVARRCVVPLLERTLDGAWLYPCSIYKRHGGAPIAPATAPLAEQQAAIHAWTLDHDCRRDPICVRHCVGCTRGLNVAANLALDGVAPAAVAPAGEGLMAAPWLLLRPLGLPHLRGILRHLRGRGLVVRSARRLDAWQSLARQLHQQPLDAEAWSAAYAALEGGDQACLLELEGPLPWGKLRRLKRELRLLYPGRQANVVVAGQPRRLRAEGVHLPEPDEAEDHGQKVRAWAAREA